MNFKVKSPEVFKAAVQYSTFIAQHSILHSKYVLIYCEIRETWFWYCIALLLLFNYAIIWNHNSWKLCQFIWYNVYEKQI